MVGNGPEQQPVQEKAIIVNECGFSQNRTGPQLILPGRTLWPGTRSRRCGQASGRWSTTLVPYAALWCLMYFSLQVSWWLTLPLAVLAAGFLVRVFIIFHDCGHGSFFPSRRANDILGFITGVLTLHALLSLALGTCPAPRQFGRPGPARHGRCVDLDGAGIPGGLTLEALRLPAGPEPGGSVRLGSPLHVLHQDAISGGQSAPAGAALGGVDQSGDRRDGRRDEPRFSALKAYLLLQMFIIVGGRLGRRMVVLRAASV